MFLRIVLWLLVIFLGISFGAGLYELRVTVPNWIRSADGRPFWNAAAALHDDVGRKFWAFVTTVPLTLLTIASLFLAWRVTGPIRGWLLGAALAALADRLITFAYFIPTMLRLMRLEDSPESRKLALQWARLDWVRIAIVLIAWLCSLKAFSEL